MKKALALVVLTNLILLAGCSVGKEHQQKAERLERANRGPPARAFGAVLGDKRGPASEAQDDESQEPERQVGPRPALSHPRQREQFGLDKKKTTVILKG